MARLIVLLLFAFPAFAGGKVDSQMIAPYVEVRSADGIGSGVVIDWNGGQFVLTARHVVELNTPVVLVKRHDDDEMETRWNADVVFVSDEADLALCKPRTRIGLTSAKVSFDVKPERGEDVWCVGTHSGIHASLEKSIVNRPSFWLKDQWSDRKYLLLNGNAWYGNSGGPVFVKRGDDYYVVGILVRLVVMNPRTPMAAEGLRAIELFLKDECVDPDTGVLDGLPWRMSQ